MLSANHVADRISVVAGHIPNLPAITVGRQVLSPLDLERIIGLTEGDIFHGRHDPPPAFQPTSTSARREISRRGSLAFICVDQVPIRGGAELAAPRSCCEARCEGTATALYTHHLILLCQPHRD